MSTCTALATKAELTAYATKAEVEELKRLLIEMQHEFIRKSDEGRIIQTTRNSIFDGQEWLYLVAAVKAIESAFKNLPNFAQFLTKSEHQVTVERLNRVFNKVDNFYADLNEAKNQIEVNKQEAKKATNAANTATKVADGANNAANANKSLIQKLNTDISQLGGTLGAIGAVVNSILSILSVVGGAAGLLSLFGLLHSVFPRLDAQEAYLDTVNYTASTALGIAVGNKITLREYKSQTDKKIRDLESDNASLRSKLAEANSRIQQLNKTLEEAKIIIQLLDARDGFLTETLTNLGLEIAEYVTETEARFAQAEGRFADLRYQANQIRSEAHRAIREANNATSMANTAMRQALDALRKAGQADDTSQQTQQDIQSGNITKRWQPQVWQPAITIAHQTAIEIVKPVKVEMGHFERQLKERQAQIDATFGKLPTFESQLATNKKEIDNLSITLPKFNDLDSINRSLDAKIDRSYKELEKLTSQTKQLETGIQTFAPKISNLEDKLPTLEQQTSAAQRSSSRAREIADEALRKASVPGRDGAPGRDGKDGLDGRPGRDGIPGAIGMPGTPGRDGKDGLDGRPGRDGKDGLDGRPGRDGRDGLDVDSQITQQMQQRISRIENENEMNNQLLQQTYQKTVETLENVKRQSQSTVNPTTEVASQKAQLDRIEKQNNNILTNTSTGITQQQTLGEQIYQQGKLTFEKVQEFFPNLKNLPNNVSQEIKPQLDSLSEKVVSVVTPVLGSVIAPAIAPIAPRIAEIVTHSINIGSPSTTNLPEQITQKLKPFIDNIPIATAILIPPVLIGSQAFTGKMTDVAAAGTCRTTLPGGCTNKTIDNAVQNINANTNNNINRLDAANAVANGAELLLLRQIDDKLGSQLAGGIGGRLSKFMNWAVADRVMNLVIFTTTLHNAMMLSNSISTTLFGCIDNIARMGQLALDPDGQAIDSSQWISKQLDSFFEGVFGKTLWTSMKASYAKANNILSTSSNVYNNLRSIHSDSQELLNMVRRDTAELGNALVEEGVISEDNWDVRNPNVKFKSKSLGRLQRMNEGLEALDNKLQAFETVTATLLSIAESAKEIKDNVTTLNEELGKANTTFKKTRDDAIKALPDFDFDIDDLF